jgi:hypothetical protein
VGPRACLYVWKNLTPTGIFFFNFGSMSLYTSTFYVTYEYNFFCLYYNIVNHSGTSILLPCSPFDHRTVQPAASRYTD